MRPTLATSGLLLAADQANVVQGFIVFGVGIFIGLVSALIIERLTLTRLEREHAEWVAAGRPERRDAERGDRRRGA